MWAAPALPPHSALPPHRLHASDTGPGVCTHAHSLTHSLVPHATYQLHSWLEDVEQFVNEDENEFSYSVRLSAYDVIQVPSYCMHVCAIAPSLPPSNCAVSLLSERVATMLLWLPWRNTLETANQILATPSRGRYLRRACLLLAVWWMQSKARKASLTGRHLQTPSSFPTQPLQVGNGASVCVCVDVHVCFASFSSLDWKVSVAGLKGLQLSQQRYSHKVVSTVEL